MQGFRCVRQVLHTRTAASAPHSHDGYDCCGYDCCVVASWCQLVPMQQSYPSCAERSALKDGADLLALACCNGGQRVCNYLPPR